MQILIDSIIMLFFIYIYLLTTLKFNDNYDLNIQNLELPRGCSIITYKDKTANTNLKWFKIEHYFIDKDVMKEPFKATLKDCEAECLKCHDCMSIGYNGVNCSMRTYTENRMIRNRDFDTFILIQCASILMKSNWLSKTKTRLVYNFCNTNIDAIRQYGRIYYIFRDGLMWMVKYETNDDISFAYKFVPQYNSPVSVTKTYNFLPPYTNIDASFYRLDGKTLLFSGVQFWITSSTNKNLNDANKSLSITMIGLPNNIQKIDAIFRIPSFGKSYIFAGAHYWEYNEHLSEYGKTLPNYPQLISSYWHGVPDYIDAVFITPHGRPYFIKDKYYYKFDLLKMRVNPNKTYPLAVPWIGCFGNTNIMTFE